MSEINGYLRVDERDWRAVVRAVIDTVEHYTARRRFVTKLVSFRTPLVMHLLLQHFRTSV